MTTNRKRVFICAVVILIITILALPGAAAPQAADDVLGAASRGLMAFLESIPAGQEPSYGFANRGEFASAALAAPYRMCTIAPQTLTGTPSPVSGQIELLDIYRVPVTVGGRMRALLTVVRSVDGWRAVDFGAAGLAASLDRLEREGPVFPGADRLFLFRQYQLAMDFTVRLKPGEAIEAGMFVPLPAALQAMGTRVEAFVLYSYPEVFNILRDRLAGAPGVGAGPAPTAAPAAKEGIR